MGRLFRNKSFVLLFQGAMVSAIGTTLYGFAGGIYVQTLFPKELYGNEGALWLGIVGGAPILFRVLVSPFAGAIVDRWNRIRILYAMDFIRGFLFLGSLYILRMGLTNYEAVILFTVVGGIGGITEGFFGPAAQSSIPDIVGDDLVQAAQGAQSIINSVTGIIGIILGGIFYSLWGIEMAILVNAISFIFSAISEMFIRTRFPHEASKEDKHIMEDIKSGFSYMKQKTGLLNMMKYSLVINFAFTPLFSVGIPFLFITQLEKDAIHMMSANVVFSLAMLIAGVTVGSMKILSVKNTVVKGIYMMSSTFAATTGIIFLITYNVVNYWVFFGMYVILISILAVFMNVVNIPLNTAMVLAIEPNYRGRVFSIIQALATAAIPLSMVLGGVVIQYSNVAFLGLISCIVMLYPMFGFTRSKKVMTFFESLDRKDDARLQEAN